MRLGLRHQSLGDVKVVVNLQFGFQFSLVPNDPILQTSLRVDRNRLCEAHQLLGADPCS